VVRTVCAGIGVILLAAGFLKASGQQPSPAPVPPTASPVPSHEAAPQSPHGALLAKYCVTCHNDKARTAGLSLQGIDVAAPGDHAEIWEKVVGKLRARAMPPAGMPRPDASAYAALITHLETELDRAAEANPNPGRTVGHRITRVEYANAIRDLLALEIDAASLLPPDNVGHGFDNIGEILSISPLLMERYMFAAERISRLAVGDPAIPAGSERYTIPTNFMQSERSSDDLPFGSRGGVAIRHYFPADGEYAIKVTLQKNADGFIRGIRNRQQLDVRLDGRRVKLFTFGGEFKGRSGPIFTENQNVEYSGDPAQVEYEFTADEALEVRFQAEAGTRVVGVTFPDAPVKTVGFRRPELVLSDVEHYKGGGAQVETVTIAGPYNTKGVGDTPSRQRIFVCSPESAQDETACATKILSTIARRAYRRTPEPTEVQDLLAIYKTGRAQGNFEAGIEAALQGIIAGPEFLFRIEREPSNKPPDTPYRLNDVDLASRLSFFLWSTIPDDELLDLAEAGKLGDPAELERQVRRMLADPRSSSLVTNFVAQWLSLRDLGGVDPDKDLFPDFDGELREAFRRETELLVGSMLREDRSVLDLLNADYTYLNERLARHYGIPDVTGSQFRRVSLSDEARYGVVGQGSMLTLTSYANRTSPVLRGKWVLERLLGMPPPPPPPDVPALEEKSKEGKALTMRAALEEHRKNPVCASCHKLMDPIGFALQNFDAVGRFRTTELDEPVDASGVLYDGNKFNGVVEFRKVLMQHSERYVNTLTKKLLTYAVGRPLEYYDDPAVRGIMRESEPGGYRWSSLILGVVKSAPFQMRRTRTS
jgi:hypothetical protein